MLKELKSRFRQQLSHIKRDQPALLVFLFHSIFRNSEEISLNHIDPQQRVTVDVYRQFLEYFLQAGYRFISPQDLDQGLDPGQRYVLATFDDGYYNNQHVAPLLKEYQTPALFFITTHNVLNNECFWWDVVHRELSQRGVNRKQISQQQKVYKKLDHQQLRDRLQEAFGAAALKPRSDIDRPFTPEELRSFADQPWVHIGNHTSDHFILDRYDAEIQRSQIVDCQKDLTAMIDINPGIFAYPNGNYNDDSVRVLAELGFDFAFTVEKRKNYLPLHAEDRLLLGRFVLWGNEPLQRQCDIFRSDVAFMSGRAKPAWSDR
jgi:peptidoglycan/xylan/chitin deacetylase (PgdA/CDA1 family)